jgi:hypothetical protein
MPPSPSLSAHPASLSEIKDFVKKIPALKEREKSLEVRGCAGAASCCTRVCGVQGGGSHCLGCGRVDGWMRGAAA